MSEEQEITKKDKKEVLLLQSEIIGKVKDLVVTALGLVAALAWNAATDNVGHDDALGTPHHGMNELPQYF